MTDFASIGIQMDSRPVVEGTKALDALGEASARVEQKVRVSNGQMADTSKIMQFQADQARAAAQANAVLGNSTSALTLGQAQLIERFREQAATVGMSRSQLMAYQAAQLGVTEQTRESIAIIKAQEDAIKAAAQAKADAANKANILSDAVKLLAGAYAALKVADYVKDSALMAARYETLGVVLTTVGRTAGYTKTQMDAAAEAVAKQGITMLESRNSVIKLVQAHVDLANASGLARIAQDAAVIGNINSSEAFERLVNGVSRGNVLILRNIGINVNLQAAYAQMADSLGKSTKELTENERVQARLNAVLERGTDIAGTYEAAMDTAGKQITSMKRYTDDLKTTFGEVFSETLTIGVMALTDGLKDANGEVSELAKNNQLEEWGHSLTKLFVTLANEVNNAFTTFQKFDSWARHLDARKAINAAADAQSKALSDYGNGMAEPGAVAKLNRIEAGRAAALAEEDASYVKRQVEYNNNYDRFERAAEERMATRRAKQKADADARLKVDQDYAARATALLIANANKSVEVQQAAQARLAKEVYQGTPSYRDTEGRELKPKIDHADSTQLQDHLARIQQSEAIDKQYFDFAMKLDDMRHKAGEISDAEYYAKRRENMDGLSKTELSMYDQQLAALRSHHNSTKEEEAKTAKAINDILDKRKASETRALNDGYLAEEEERLRQKGVAQASEDATNRYTSDLQKQLDAIEAATGKRQQSKSAIEEETAALYEQAVANMKLQASAPVDGLHTQADHDAAVQMLADLEKELSLHKQLAEALRDQESAQAIAKASAALDNYLDPTKAEKFGHALRGSFDGAAKSMEDLVTAMQRFGAHQAANDKARAEAQLLLKGTDAQRAKGLADLEQINRKGTQEQLAGYGNMTAAAAGFFNEHSRGYQALTTMSQVFHAAELAMTMAELVPKAISAVLTQGQGDPYTAFGRMAAMGALVAGLGVAIGGIGGGGANIAADRQKAQGAGSVFGDSDAKSESIKRALDAVEKNTYQDLAVSGSMLATLRSIDSNISGFARQVVGNTDIANPNIGALNSNNGFGTNIVSGGLAAVGGMAAAGLTAFTSMAAIAGPLGMLAAFVVTKIPFIANIVGKIGTAIFGGKQSVEDSGFTIGKDNLASILAGGANGMSYADIKTSGGWFSKDKTSTQSATLDAQANQQFTLILKSMADGITQAAGMLGAAGSEFDLKLSSFVVDIGKISLKGLSGEEQQKALESVFSKLGDDMAKFAVGGLEQVQQVGEGYLETLTRVASEYQTVEVVFQSFGKTFGEVGISSIAARDRLVQLAGGLDKFTSQGEYFLTNFFSEQEQAAALKARIDPTLAKYGLSTAGEGAMKAFRDVVVGLNTTTEAGAAAYTELMTIAPAFKSVTDAAKSLQDQAKDLQNQLNDLVLTQAQKDAAARAALDPTNQLLFDQVQQAKAVAKAKADLASAYQTEAQGMQSAVERLKTFGASLRSFVNSLQLGNMSLLNPADKYGAALTQFNSTLAKAQAGDADAQNSLQSVAQSFLQASKDANASNSTYQSDYQRVIAASNVMADRAAAQVTEGQANLAALREQIKQLTDLNGNTLGMGDLISNTGLSIVEAINNLGIILAGGKNQQVNGSALTSLYQELMGRAPDAEGFKFWSDALQNGVSFTHIVDEFKNSPEYLAKMGMQSPVTSVTPSTQYGSVLPMGDPTQSVSQLYAQILGRAPDAEGLKFWVDAAKNGVPLSHIADELNASPEHMGLVPPPAMTPPAPSPAVASSSGQNAQLVAQMASVNAQLATLIKNAQQQSDNQVDATMTAGADTSAAVEQSATIAARQARWEAQNKVSLR